MPTEVWTASDLDNVRNDLSGNYIQMADIDLITYNWEPIGDWSTPFTGSYNGSNFLIENLTIDRVAETGQSLFGTIEGANLSNIKIPNADIIAFRAFGVLFGLAKGGVIEVENCHVSGSIYPTGYIGFWVGGLCGSVENTLAGSYIRRCSANVDIALQITDYADVSNIGGLIGYCEGTSVINCYARGSITYSDSTLVYYWYNVGGLIGAYYGDSVENCYAATDAIPLGVHAAWVGELGGLIGEVWSGSITNSYYDSETSGMSDTGKGDARTTAEMIYPYDDSINLTYVDWDFSTIWHHDKSKALNGGYPQFEAMSAVRRLIFKVPYMV